MMFNPHRLTVFFLFLSVWYPSSSLEKPSTSKRTRPRVRVSSSPDRISDLPDDVLCRILSCLPTKVSATTSILSRRWKTLWTKVPAIEFVEDHDQTDKVKTMSFIESVRSAVFCRRDEPLEKLRVKGLPSDDDRDRVYVRAFIKFAIARNVRFIDLHLFRNELGYLLSLPDAVFLHDQLESLTLSGNFMLELPVVVRLPKLQVLKLSHVYYDREDGIHDLISGSPLLHHLLIYQNHLDANRCYRISSSSLKLLEFHFDAHDCSDHNGHIRKLEIDAPKLEHLILDDFLCKVISVGRMDSVISATLYLTCIGGFDGPDARFNSSVNLVESLKTVEYLKIREDAMMALSLATTPVLSYFKRLTELHIDMDCCYWSCLSRILSHATRLRVLKLTKFSCDNYNHQVCWEDPGNVPQCLSSSLVQVSVKGIHGSEDEMGMVRYILRHGGVLQSVNLVSAIELDFEDKFRTVQKILMFPRASGGYSITFQ